MGISISSKQLDYEIIVKTGDVKGAGTDANVYISLIDEQGRKSREISLDCTWRDDFEKGNTDSFKVRNVPQLGKIEKIELWRDSKGLNDDWFVEWIKVRPVRKLAMKGSGINKGNSKNKAVENELKYGIPFPCNRWIKEHIKFIFKKYDACLPQFDDCKQQRKEELERKREQYAFQEKAPGLPRQVTKAFLVKINTTKIFFERGIFED